METLRQFPNISRKNAVTFFILIMAGFAFFTIPYFDRTDLFYPNGLSIITSNQPSDFDGRIIEIKNQTFPGINIGTILLEQNLYKIFPNWNLLPTVSSFALLITVYLFGLKLSGNRLIPLISIGFLAITKTFYWYSMSVTYPNLDALLMIISLYPFSKLGMVKKLVLWSLSVFMKGTTLFMFPTLFSSIKGKKSRILSILISAGLFTFAFLKLFSNPDTFKSHDILGNILNLTHDYWVLPVLPVICILLWTSKHQYSKLFLLAICNSIIIPFVLFSTTMFTIQPYRFILTMSLLAVSFNIVLPDIFIKLHSLKTKLT